MILLPRQQQGRFFFSQFRQQYERTLHPRSMARGGRTMHFMEQSCGNRSSLAMMTTRRTIDRNPLLSLQQNQNHSQCGFHTLPSFSRKGMKTVTARKIITLQTNNSTFPSARASSSTGPEEEGEKKQEEEEEDEPSPLHSSKVFMRDLVRIVSERHEIPPKECHYILQNFAEEIRNVRVLTCRLVYCFSSVGFDCLCG